MYKINYPSFFVSCQKKVQQQPSVGFLLRPRAQTLRSWTGSGYSVSASSRKEQQRSLAMLVVRLVFFFLFLNFHPMLRNHVLLALDKVYMIPRCKIIPHPGSGTNWKWFSSHTNNVSASPTVMLIGDPESTTMFRQLLSNNSTNALIGDSPFKSTRHCEFFVANSHHHVVQYF